MAQVRWTLRAAQDIQDLESYIAADSPLHASRFCDRLVDAGDGLSANPRLGRMVPEFRRQSLREIFYGAYRVVYLFRGDDVIILRVVHGARDLRSLIRREPWDLA